MYNEHNHNYRHNIINEHNAHNEPNSNNDLFGLSFSFESHIPENVVNQMNNILVQKIHLLHKSTL
jgi:hypothetical protein